MTKRKVKCKHCKKELYNDEAFKVTLNGKNFYYCNEEEYNSIQREKDEYNSCLLIVAETMNTKFVAPVMVKKIKELRDFYNYNVIGRTFKECKQTIQWSVENKDFNNEFVKAKYITSIVANNIARIDKKIKQEKKEIEKLFEKSNNDIDLEIMDISANREIKNKDVSDISMFLD